MAIYSETMNDENILSLIPNGAKNILIVACGGCVNESLAYDYDIPILSDSKPYASNVEATRISNLLTHNGFSTEIKLLDGDLPVLCIYSSENLRAFLETSFDFDNILALSCKSGALGLRGITDKPVESITKQIGYLAYTYKDDDGKRNMIKELSKREFV